MMSLPNRVDDVSFYSGFSVDKIVKTFSGSYNRATDVVARNYTFAGFPYTVYFYRIPHGLPRPVTCEMIESTDGGTTYIDGGINRIAISDSTYVYIFDSAGALGAGTVNYKVWCSWIDDYDSTNPLIDVDVSSSRPMLFDSRENYQKIADQNVLTFSPGTFGSSETAPVSHTLGITPNAKVFFEAFPNEVWPLNAGGTGNGFLVDDAQDECELKITTTNIQVIMNRYSNASKRAWYKIYYDAD